MRLIKINYCVMPDLISLPRQLVSRGHPEYIAPSFLDSGFRRNDKSLRLHAHEVMGRAALENLLRLKVRGFNHPRKRH
jgi:hypothetical protein